MTKNPVLILVWLFGILLTIGLFYRFLFWFYGLTVTSWWRSPANNDYNDGKPLSLHLIGMAWDIRIRGEEGTDASSKIREMLDTWMPWARTVPESDHIHVQFL